MLSWHRPIPSTLTRPTKVLLEYESTQNSRRISCSLPLSLSHTHPPTSITTMSADNTVDVYNISPKTSKQSLRGEYTFVQLSNHVCVFFSHSRSDRACLFVFFSLRTDFFSFCGTITTVELWTDKDGTQSAHIVFAKDSAGQTAVMLNGGSLDGSPLKVETPGVYSLGEASATGLHPQIPPNTVGQEDKPRTAVVAEILAHGYALTDDVAKRAVDFDNTHGVSERFKGYLASLDRTLGERVIKGTSNEPITGKTEGTPSGPLASEAASEKSAQQTPLPGTTAGHEDKFTTTVPQPDAKAEAAATQGTAQQPSLLRHFQGQVQTQLDRPEIKSKTDLAWTKLTEVSGRVAHSSGHAHDLTLLPLDLLYSTTLPLPTTHVFTTCTPKPARLCQTCTRRPGGSPRSERREAHLELPVPLPLPPECRDRTVRQC